MIVPKAFEKSKKIPHVILLSSIAVYIFSRVSRIACSVKYPFLKPNWKSKSKHCFSRKNKLIVYHSFQNFTERRDDCYRQLLNMGVTLDILKISVTTPNAIDPLYILVKGTESGPLANLISLLGTSRHALFSFNQANN